MTAKHRYYHALQAMQILWIMQINETQALGKSAVILNDI